MVSSDKIMLPDGWKLVRLDEVAEVIGGSTPSRASQEYWDGDIPWVVPSELTVLTGRYLNSTNESITSSGMKAAGLKLIPSGSILLTSRATIGVTAINTIPVCTNQGFQNLVLKGDGVDLLWLFYCISSMRKDLEKKASGSTFNEISRGSVRSLPVILPPLSEQRNIATALDSIDNALERTEIIVTSTKNLKASALKRFYHSNIKE